MLPGANTVFKERPLMNDVNELTNTAKVDLKLAPVAFHFAQASTRRVTNSGSRLVLRNNQGYRAMMGVRRFLLQYPLVEVQFLRYVACFFDPLGLIGPVVVQE